MLMIHFFSISIIRAFYSQVFPTRLSALPSSHTLFSSLLQQPLKKYSHFTSALRMMSSDNRMMSPSAQRNAPHILNVFQQHVVSREDPGGAESIKILEIASGSGEHAVNIAGALGNQVTWQPTDVDESSLRSIQSWITAAGVTNVLEPFPLDVACFDPASFPVEGWSTVDGIVNINMVHISPWSCCEGLWRTAGALVRPGGFVYMVMIKALDRKIKQTWGERSKRQTYTSKYIIVSMVRSVWKGAWWKAISALISPCVPEIQSGV